MRSALLTTLFLLAAGGLTAQDPKAAPPPMPPQPDPKAAQPPMQPATPTAPLVSDFFPAKKGTKWTFKYAESKVVMEVVEVGPEIKINTLSGEKVVASESLKLAADGIYRTKINNLEITPAAKGEAGLKILDMVAKDGKLVPKAKDVKWPVDVKVQQAQLKGEYKIGDAMKAKLPIGEVDCIPVEAKLNIGGTETVVLYWFAAGKGLVKVSYKIGTNEQTMELEKFEEGK